MNSFGGTLSDTQRSALLEPIKPHRVNTKSRFPHVESFEIIAHLTRLFGFEGWDKEVRDLTLVFDTEGSDGKWTVAYRCTVRLTVRDTEGMHVTTKEDASIGQAINQPVRADAHDLAVKSAVSGALKRCAKDLGDQFGLSLYDDGSFNQTVYRVIPYETKPETDDKPSAEDYLA